MNPHQQQLLQILQIRPLQLQVGFEQFQAEEVIASLAKPSNSEDLTHTIEDHLQPISQIPTEFSALAADIQQAIQEYLPNVGWRWSSQLDVCALQGTEIQTPNLSMLTTAAGKRQLWQVMSQHSAVDVSSSHDSN
ncbi:MAG: hypothetical protein ACK4NN_10705 [Rheinheimera sp.]